MTQCKKVTFPSEKEAKRRIKEIKKSKYKNIKPFRSYECKKCGGWHLTSKKKRKN